MCEAIGLRHRQGIHVGAQTDGPRARPRSQHPNDPRFAHACMNFQAELGQPLGHQRRGSLLLKRQFWMGMNVAADRDKLFVISFDVG